MKWFVLLTVVVVCFSSCGLPNGCESIEATSLSDCFDHGCDGAAAVKDDRVFFICRDQSAELQLAMANGEGTEYEGPPCAQADSATLLDAIGVDDLLGAFTYSHLSVENPYWGVGTLHARVSLPNVSEAVTGTASAFFVCNNGVWNVVDRESALSLQTDRGKVAVASDCGAACAMCIADGYRCGGGCQDRFVGDSLRMVSCRGRIPYESEHMVGR